MLKPAVKNPLTIEPLSEVEEPLPDLCWNSSTWVIVPHDYSDLLDEFEMKEGSYLLSFYMGAFERCPVSWKTVKFSIQELQLMELDDGLDRYRNRFVEKFTDFFKERPNG